MERNDYGSLIEQWKVDLIRTRARRFYFRKDEMDDLEQIIVPQLVEANFDPIAPAGASERTFIITIIDRQLMKVKRDRQRDVRRVNYESPHIEDKGALTTKDVASLSRCDRPELALDLQRALASFTPVERAICQAFKEGQSQADIARATGRSKAAICNEVQKLQAKFRDWGLEEYIGRKIDG